MAVILAADRVKVMVILRSFNVMFSSLLFTFQYQLFVDCPLDCKPYESINIKQSRTESSKKIKKILKKIHNNNRMKAHLNEANGATETKMRCTLYRSEYKMFYLDNFYFIFRFIMCVWMYLLYMYHQTSFVWLCAIVCIVSMKLVFKKRSSEY